jgi:uncharacterized membrane protein SpoIIM required for sporulation
VDIDTFIAKYRPDWERLERATRSEAALARLPGPELDGIVALYLRVSGHLAEAQGRYGDPQLVGYLTSVVSRAHGAIYGGRSRSVPELASALTVRYRKAVRRTAPFVWVSAALFLGVLFLALAWVATSPEARAGILPPGAEEAVRNVAGERADFGIGPAALSTAIFLNNIQVAFLGFALGLALGVGTVWVLLLNAVNIGVIAGAYHAFGQAGTFWALVLPHGLLELTAIFIACGAGLRMGWSVIAPGDRPRRRAVAEEAREAVLVVAGVIPAFVLAGLIEGFLTFSAVPTPIQLLTGVVVWVAYVSFLLWPARRPIARPEAAPPPYSRP